MYIVTGKITRQNIADSFYTIADPIVTDDIRLYWVQEYKETGKCINVNVNLSPNEVYNMISNRRDDILNLLTSKMDPDTIILTGTLIKGAGVIELASSISCCFSGVKSSKFNLSTETNFILSTN